MGTERGTIAAIADIVAAFEKGFPESLAVPRPKRLWAATKQETKRRGFKKDSPNHRDTGVGAEVARSAAYGTKLDYELAAEQAYILLDLYLHDVGLWTSEQFTGRPHGGMYLDGFVAMMIGAFHKGDTRLLAELGKYHDAMLRYMFLTATPDLEVWCCGERMSNGPVAQQQSAWLRQLLGEAHKGELAAGENFKRNIGDDAWVSIRGLQALQQRDMLTGVTCIPDSLPRVARQIEVLRWSGGHLAYYVRRPPRGYVDVCDWVLVDHRRADEGNEKDMYAGIQYGVGFSSTPPLGKVPSSARVYRSP
jgi:hypothetical protein